MKQVAKRYDYYFSILSLLIIHSTVTSSVLSWKDDNREIISGNTTAVIDTITIYKHLNQRFISVALDTALVSRHWCKFNFSSKKLQTLTEALSPGYLRLGGNYADFLVFRTKVPPSYRTNSAVAQECGYSFDEVFKNISTFYMSAKDFDELNIFAAKTGHRLLFDFNVLLRDKAGNWNSSNTREILDYSIKQNYTGNLDFELGNEPNSFHHDYNRTVSAVQLGRDFGTLYSVLHKDERYSAYFKKSLLIGPSITQPKPVTLKYLTEFLPVVGDRINAISWHHYYEDGRKAVIDDFMSYDLMNELDDEITSLYKAVDDIGYGNATYWLGETSSCYGGGAPGLSDRYVAGFLWLDKLGIAARRGIDVVIRQSLYHENYALLDKSLNPNPDYWLTWLYKTFVGSRVLKVSLKSSQTIRLYAHCTRQNKRTGYVAGGVTLYALNLGDDDVKLELNPALALSDRHVYWLQPYGSHGLKSRSASLNGKLLKMVDDATLPNIEPVVIPSGHDLVLASRSFGFIVIPNSQAAACT